MRMAAMVGLGMTVDTFLIEPHWLDFVQRDLPVENLPPVWEGRTLAHVSDVHVGHQVSEDYLLRSFERIAEFEPDVIVVTGDFMTGSRTVEFPEEQLDRMYREFPHGRIATLGSFGNHDYGRTWHDAPLSDMLDQLLGAHGVRVLRNETVDLDGLQITGCDELWAGRCKYPKAVANVRDTAARVVLSHNPDAVDQERWAGFRGWILAGHTHGGQCRLPLLRPPILPIRNKRYSAGEFRLEDGRRLYVNRGLGHSLPVRFNCRPEVTLFRLTATAPEEPADRMA